MAWVHTSLVDGNLMRLWVAHELSPGVNSLHPHRASAQVVQGTSDVITRVKERLWADNKQLHRPERNTDVLKHLAETEAAKRFIRPGHRLEGPAEAPSNTSFYKL